MREGWVVVGGDEGVKRAQESRRVGGRRVGRRKVVQHDEGRRRGGRKTGQAGRLGLILE